MQLLIDVNEETPVSLRLAASVLLIMAGLPALTESEITAAARPGTPLKTPPAPPLPKPTTIPPAPPPPAPLPPDNVPPAPIIHPDVHPDALPKAPDVPTGTTGDELDPAKVFGGAAFPTGTAPATAAAVPAAPPAGAPAAVADATLPTGQAFASNFDKAGIPWDARVHSDTMKTNADGTWRFRRNLDVAVKTAVMAELTAQYGAQVQLPQPAAAVASAVPVPPAPAAVPVAPVAAAAVPVPPAPAAGPVLDATVSPPAAPAVPVPPAADIRVPDAPRPVVLSPVTSFRELMQKVNVALASGKLRQDQLSEACKAAGVDSVAALAAQPMKVGDVDINLNRYLVAA